MSPECKSNFDNCGPDVTGDYCLFHKLEKTEEEAERFYQKIKEMWEIGLLKRKVHENLRVSYRLTQNGEKVMALVNKFTLLEDKMDL